MKKGSNQIIGKRNWRKSRRWRRNSSSGVKHLVTSALDIYAVSLSYFLNTYSYPVRVWPISAFVSQLCILKVFLHTLHPFFLGSSSSSFTNYASIFSLSCPWLNSIQMTRYQQTVSQFLRVIPSSFYNSSNSSKYSSQYFSPTFLKF